MRALYTKCTLQECGLLLLLFEFMRKDGNKKRQKEERKTVCDFGSHIQIPAFVALRDGGGLKWLQYEIALPWAMIVVMAILVPIYRRTKAISAYEVRICPFFPLGEEKERVNRS